LSLIAVDRQIQVGGRFHSQDSQNAKRPDHRVHSQNHPNWRDASVALVVVIYSALKKQSALPGLMILGDLSIQGNIKALRSLAEPLQVGMDNGARRALIPIENKRNFLDVSADIMERVAPAFYGDPLTAAMKALGMN